LHLAQRIALDDLPVAGGLAVAAGVTRRHGLLVLFTV
jgi:hypothetical protein